MLCGIDDEKGLLSLRSVVRLHPGALVHYIETYLAATLLYRPFLDTTLCPHHCPY
jgi:hypothetical protein